MTICAVQVLRKVKAHHQKAAKLARKKAQTAGPRRKKKSNAALKDPNIPASAPDFFKEEVLRDLEIRRRREEEEEGNEICLSSVYVCMYVCMHVCMYVATGAKDEAERKREERRRNSSAHKEEEEEDADAAASMDADDDDADDDDADDAAAAAPSLDSVAAQAQAMEKLHSEAEMSRIRALVGESASRNDVDNKRMNVWTSD